MTALSQRTEELLGAPVGAAFFVLADRYGLDPEHLAQPGTASMLATEAIAWLNPWSGTAAAERTEALRAAPCHRSLAIDVLADPRNAWWSAPLDRGAQLLLLDQDALGATPAPDPMQVPVPAHGGGSEDGGQADDPDGSGEENGDGSDWWQVYAQRPTHQIMTTTEVVPAHTAASVRSGAHAELAGGVSDWDPTYPIQVQRLQVSATARVAEVHSAADWHHLATTYGDQAAASDASLWQSAGIDNGPAPVWGRLARDFDAVHVSLAGLLSGLYVPVSSPGNRTTTLWAWYFESTWWMRSVFTAVQDLPPLLGAPEDDRP